LRTDFPGENLVDVLIFCDVGMGRTEWEAGFVFLSGTNCFIR